MPHPKKMRESEKNIRQIPFRVHMNDKAVFLKMLSDRGYNFQAFANYCMQAYLAQDPGILKVLKDWKTLSEVPKDHLERYSLSSRERDMIQRELEEMRTSEEQQCNECDGKGEWFDGSHGANRRCKPCDGSGIVTK